eukprot:scaffold78873_cov19-Tisochrysis_lutea.AAC.3
MATRFASRHQLNHAFAPTSTLKSSLLSRPPLFKAPCLRSAATMAQEADISLDVYCSSHKVQEELQGRLQAAPLEGVHLRWQPAGFAPEHGTSSSGAVDQGGNAESDQAQSSFDGPRYMAVLKRGGRMGQALVTAQEMTSTQVRGLGSCSQILCTSSLTAPCDPRCSSALLLLHEDQTEL